MVGDAKSVTCESTKTNRKIIPGLGRVTVYTEVAPFLVREGLTTILAGHEIRV